MDGRTVSIGVDCDGDCPGPDFNVQMTDVDLAGTDPLQSFVNAPEKGFLTFYGELTQPGICSVAVPVDDGDVCRVDGGDTCCVGECKPTGGQCP